MRREVTVLACGGLVLLGTVANIVAGPRKTVGNIGTGHEPDPTPGSTTRRHFGDFPPALADRGRTGRWLQNREFGDVHHSAAVRLALPSNHQLSLALSGEKKCKKYPQCCRMW